MQGEKIIQNPTSIIRYKKWWGRGLLKKKSWEQNVKKGFFKNVPGNPVPSHFAMSFVCIV